MKITEIVSKYTVPITEAQVGRDLEHIENNLITGGAQSALDSLNELKKIGTKPGETSVKWDGTMAIYWGNDENGEFYLVPNAQWSKSLVLDKASLANEIQTTGRKNPTQSDAEFKKARQALAQKYLNLWDIFEEASQGTQGFFKGDIMFAERQTPDASGNYVFTPNKVTYTVTPNGLYGKMPTASVFVTVHGKANQLGSSALVPANPSEMKKLNRTDKLIALDIQRPKVVNIKVDKLDRVINDVKSNANALNTISNYTAPKFTTIKQLMYNYAIKLGKSHDRLSFDDWLESSKVSENQKVILRELAKTPAWKTFWRIFADIKRVKHDVLDQLHKQHGKEMADTLGITASIGDKRGGEGYVTSAGKLVNPFFRSAPDNPRFTGEI